MRVHNVHTRMLPAAPERVSALLAGLAGPNDELWPIERWPTTPIEFDRPLEVGARGGHGLIRYRVEAYEPGRNLVFRFEPGNGLEGIHRFDVEPRGADGTQLIHTLDTRLTGVTPLLKRPLLALHDRLIEDLLDKAQAATSGNPVKPRPMPRWMRTMNAVEAQLLPRAPGMPRGRGARLSGVAVPTALVGLAALHGAWGLGWRWPGGSDSAFAERVIGSGEVPPNWATFTVAGLLLAAAGLVRSASQGSDSAPVRAAAFTVATVLLARGGAGLVLSLGAGLDTIYQRLNVTIYSPLCLVLGAGTLLAVRHAPPTVSHPSAGANRVTV